ncbi:MAG: alpha/beta hydrolase [Sphingobacteriales bacterium]|nr:alpha/beta hydrolase [Sphingobacteriales bacterium]
MKYSLLILGLILSLASAKAQNKVTMDLYPNGVPNAKPAQDYIEKTFTNQYGMVNIVKVSKPELLAYYPENPNGTAIIIFPGGGYSTLAMKHEGYDIAEAFYKMGVTAFIVKYRLPSDLIMENKTIGPLQDAQQAIKTVRENAEKWQINPNLIGIMGFSAGGHLASTLATHFQKAVIDNPKGTSLRPDFAILGYPVITMGPLTHQGSKNNLLGLNPADELVKLYSNELQVTPETPPTFLVQAIDDKTVPVENSIMLTEALKKAGVKCELHLYQAGGHGFGLHNKTTKDFWFDRMMNWMKANQFTPD